MSRHNHPCRLTPPYPGEPQPAVITPELLPGRAGIRLSISGGHPSSHLCPR